MCGIDIETNSMIQQYEKKFPRSFLFKSCNILDKELELSVDEIKSFLGSPNVLINNAAIDNPPSLDLRCQDLKIHQNSLGMKLRCKSQRCIFVVKFWK